MYKTPYTVTIKKKQKKKSMEKTPEKQNSKYEEHHIWPYFVTHYFIKNNSILTNLH